MRKRAEDKFQEEVLDSIEAERIKYAQQVTHQRALVSRKVYSHAKEAIKL